MKAGPARVTHPQRLEDLVSETFSLILGILIVAVAIAVSVFLYLNSRRPRSAPLSAQEQAEHDSRSETEAAQGPKIRIAGRGAGL